MKALLLSNRDNLHAQIAFLCAQRTSPLALTWVALPQIDAVLAADQPDLLIVDDITGVQPGLLESFSVQHPALAIMLLSADPSPQLLLQAMRAGVREVVALPLEQQALNQALDRLAHKAAGARNGKVVSFIACKGGSGATFLATNFAYALARQTRRKVLLIDLNQQFGDAALFLSDKKPATTLADVCAQIDRVDGAFLEASLLEIVPGFGVLAASDDPTHAGDIKPENIMAILRIARTSYDYVVLDVGRQIDAVTISALDQSDLIHPVMQLTMPGLRDAARLFEVFRSLGYRRDKTCLIVNRYEKSGELRLADVEAATGSGRLETMPNHYKAVTESINQGLPVLELARNSPISRSLVGLVEQLAGTGTARAPGVLGRLFAHRLQALASNA